MVLAVALIAGCDSSGRDRVLGIEATGVVQGLVFFDGNGTRELELTDAPLPGIGVRLLARGTRDTIARASSDANGIYRMRDVPVGSYDVVVDPATVGDSVQVVRIDTAEVTLTPDDSVDVAIAVSFPKVTVTEARGLTLGTKVFIEGIALNGRETFGDETVHLAGTSAAIRLTRVKPAIIFAGDSVRFLGTTSTSDGQPTLDDATAFVIAIVRVPPADSITTAIAAAASGGQLDAALVQVINATIIDTLSVAGDLRLTLDDGSGPLGALLDGDAPFTALERFAPDSTVDATGLLVPSPGGNWRLKPRSDADLVLK